MGLSPNPSQRTHTRCRLTCKRFGPLNRPYKGAQSTMAIMLLLLPGAILGLWVAGMWIGYLLVCAIEWAQGMVTR